MRQKHHICPWPRLALHRTVLRSVALIEAGVREVVYAHADPNPKTAGQGPQRLRAAGIRVRKARPTAAIRAQLAPYLTHLDRDRPWVIAKWAMTLDGRAVRERRSSPSSRP